MLLHAIANGQQLLIGQANPFAIKRAHLIDPVGKNPHVHELFCELHLRLSTMNELHILADSALAGQTALNHEVFPDCYIADNINYS